jgi:TPR repeat protein
LNQKEDGIKVTKREIQKARENDAETFYKIGSAYSDGDKKSFIWLYKAARQNHAQAQRQIGMMYKFGCGAVPQDDKQSFFWFMKAASTGNAHAQYIIGQLYLRGDGISTDYKQAMDWKHQSYE